jgi:predicted ATPase/DNA-binding winged helix-turn-helix (wHTH) protein
MTISAARTREVISFGPFSLAVGERLLTRNGVRVELGSRTLDVLISLLSRPNELVGKRDLLAQVWPEATVEEGSLRFHIASLRRALGDGKGGARYISTLPGRGYSFVAHISHSGDGSHDVGKSVARFPHANLPSRLARMVGRTDDALLLSRQLLATRFVTIVGTGGVGKTTLAVAVGHDLIEAFAGAVHFVDLGAIEDASLVVATIASMLGLSVQSADATPNLIAYLRDKRLLLILDTCEHVIEAVAALTSRIFAAAPQVHILATSREALRVEGEHIYRLAPLACPPDGPGLTVAIVRTFAATQLFVERAMASGASRELSDADAAVAARICRKLDGVPLAIELAAGRVGSHGLQKTAELLDLRLALLWTGQRTASPRQKTLQATLDWSYGLLSELERMVLRQLAVFVGHFTIEAALDVVTSVSVDHAAVFGVIDSLVAKSMVAIRPTGALMRYRLLDTTRAYALQIGDNGPELAELASRHANHYLGWLERTGAEWPSLPSAAQRATHLAGLSNVRAALEWSFGTDGDARLGVRLAAAAAPMFLAMSLLTECHRWSERAIDALNDAARDACEEMRLQAALGVSLMFTRGGKDSARVALNRSFAIAEQRHDALDQLQVLAPLQMFHLRTGEFNAALGYAERCSVFAGTLEDAATATLAHSLMGISLHLSGSLDRARIELEAALQRAPWARRSTRIYLGFECKGLAGAILARTLWLQGHPDQAMERARLTVKDATGMDHALTLAISLVWAISVFLWTGDLNSAAEHIDWLISCSEVHSLSPYVAVGHGFKAEVAIRRGDASRGVENLLGSLKELHAAPYELLTTPLNLSLVQGLAATSRFPDALALIDETIERIEANGDRCYLPEALRVKGNLLLAGPSPAGDEAERHLARSLELSARQGTRAWALRAAIDLAELFIDHEQPERARALLLPIFEQFQEGLDTLDLKVAEQLLVGLGLTQAGRADQSDPANLKFARA